MLTATLNGQKINCFDGKYDENTLKKWTNKKIIKCPVCGGSYEYCHGKIKIPYFRHMDKAECEDIYSESETEEHLRGKIDLYNWLCTLPNIYEVKLEDYIKETKQRPDISFMYKNKLHVLEYQCTPISSEYIERHKLYEVAGIRDIWICGTENYFQYYHTGKGIKRMNYLEDKTRKYYNSKTKTFFYLNQYYNEKDFKLYSKKSNYEKYNWKENEIIKTHKDCRFIKDRDLSFKTERYCERKRNRQVVYKSKTTFVNNNSLATCTPLEYVEIKDLKAGVLHG